DNINPHLQQHLQIMAGLDNIPRKEKQFINFTSNSLNLRGNHGKGVVSEIWNILKEERERRTAEREQKEKEAKEEKEKKKVNDDNKPEESPLPRKETKTDSSSKRKKQKKGDDNSSSSTIIDTKKVHKAMKKTLKKAPKQTMKLKALRKLLLKELGLPKSSKKQLQQIVKEHNKVAIDGKVVTLKRISTE
ncbi:MAG: hypothetical protein SGILL_005750, partial [Bacillariaceae sp.]